MKTRALLTALAVTLIALLPVRAQQPYLLNFSDTLGDPNAAAIAPGGSFTVTLSLASTASSVSVDYFLQILNGGSGQFRLTGRDLGGSTFSDLTFADSIALQPSRALLDPQNDDTLGGSIADPNSPNAAGQFLVANLTLQTLAGTSPGTYTLSTATASVGDGDFNSNSVGDATYTVTVVPEPGTYLLLGIGLLMCAQRFMRPSSGRTTRSHRWRQFRRKH